MTLSEIFKEDWTDAKDIHLVTRGFTPLAGKSDLFLNIINIITILIPFLSSRKKSDPVNTSRVALKKLRKDLKKGRINEEEYNLLRTKVLLDLQKLIM